MPRRPPHARTLPASPGRRVERGGGFDALRICAARCRLRRSPENPAGQAGSHESTGRGAPTALSEDDISLFKSALDDATPLRPANRVVLEPPKPAPLPRTRVSEGEPGPSAQARPLAQTKTYSGSRCGMCSRSGTPAGSTSARRLTAARGAMARLPKSRPSAPGPCSSICHPGSPRTIPRPCSTGHCKAQDPQGRQSRGRVDTSGGAPPCAAASGRSIGARRNPRNPSQPRRSPRHRG